MNRIVAEYSNRECGLASVVRSGPHGFHVIFQNTRLDSVLHVAHTLIKDSAISKAKRLVQPVQPI